MISNRAFFLLLIVALITTATCPVFAAGRAVLTTKSAPQPQGPYAQGVSIDNLVFTAGQIGLNPDTDKMQEGLEAQVKQTLDNVKAILEAGGSSLDKVVMVTIYLKDLNDFGKMNEIYAAYFAGNVHARSCIQAARIPRDALIEIEAIGVKQGLK
ncbi:MAG: Rid family detoxifying hydrolase [Desulfovibrio sp.]|nr:Rid family detoxifying hydrolase [Desulfovibrio sp.]